MRLTTLLLLSCFAGPAFGHPHVFVDAGAGFRFEDGRLAALRITWRYDEFTSLVLFDQLDLDRDGDGSLDESDLAAIVAGETTWAEGYDGDIHLRAGGRAVAMAQPVNGRADYRDGRVGVAFDLPLAEPIEVDEALLELYDPTYYYAYSVIGPVEVTGMQACAAELLPFEPDAETAALRRTLAALSREEVPDDENVGALFADAIRLTCD